MDIDTLNILADAISDVGSWQRWSVKGDIVPVEFCDVQLYDEAEPEKIPHSTDVLGVRFSGHAFAVFFDNMEEEHWHEHFRDDDSILYPIDAWDLAFDDINRAGSLLNDYKNRIPVKNFRGLETLSTAKHLLCAKCGAVGFIVGGDEFVAAGRKGKYTEEEIKASAMKWGAIGELIGI